MSRPTSSWQRALGGLVLTSMLGLGCEAPPVVPTADRRQHSTTARIEGNLVVQSQARGNAIVFLYDADRPPPPQGTGRPLAFTVIPAAELFGANLGNTSPGPFTAPFTFSLVAEGRYALRGFIDADTCRFGTQPCHTSDFNPWYGVTSEPNTGDVGGAAVDLANNGAVRTLEVKPDADGQLQPLTGVSMLFSDTARVPLDRPAFQVEVVQGNRVLTGSGTTILRLRPESLQQGVVQQQPPGFLVSYNDVNGDGQPDDLNGDGTPDSFWPRVVVRKLANAPSVLDENDLDRNGVPDDDDPSKADYPHADGTKDGKADVVVLAAGLVPGPLNDALTKPDGTPYMGSIVVPELQLAVRPQALDARESTPVPLQGLPSGRYAVVLITSTGQTWRVPNELTPTLAPGLGLPAVESQSFVLEVP